MHPRMRNKIVIWFGLLGCCHATHALMLGDVAGPAVIGERLSVVVPLRLTPDERLEEACLSATVRFGDDKVPGIQVGVHPLADAGQGPALRVVTGVPVTEPWVTVQVSAGCASPVTRKYVVMADPPVLQLTTPTVSSTSSVPSAPAARYDTRPAPSTPKRNAPWRALPEDAGRLYSLKTADVAEASDAGVRPARRARPSAQAVSRLLLDPMAADALVEPHLRLDMGLQPALDTGLPVNEQARRSMARAYWWALQATPQDMNQMQARLQDLEQQVADLLAAQSAPADVAEDASAASAASAAKPKRITSSKQLPVDADEVAHVRLVGLLCVAALGLAGVAYRRWLDHPSPLVDRPLAG